MNNWNPFYGPNAGYLIELYERYSADPSSVDAQTQAFFAEWTPPADDPEVAAIAKASAAPALDVIRIVGGGRPFGEEGLGLRIDRAGVGAVALI